MTGCLLELVRRLYPNEGGSIQRRGQAFRLEQRSSPTLPVWATYESAVSGLLAFLLGATTLPTGLLALLLGARTLATTTPGQPPQCISRNCRVYGVYVE